MNEILETDIDDNSDIEVNRSNNEHETKHFDGTSNGSVNDG